MEDIEKYILATSLERGLKYHKKGRSPVIKVKEGKIIEPKKVDLEGLDFTDWIKENPNGLNLENYNSDWKPFKIPLDLGEDYKIDAQLSDIPGNFFNDLRSLKIILHRLNDVFTYIEPSPKNKNTFSLELRNIILLSAMEVESHWQTLMRDNGYKKDRLTTKDYVRLLEFIDFDMEFSLILNNEYENISPFKDWNSSLPTKSLKWYNAYNKIKHDRIQQLDLATLENAINSTCALITLLCIRWSTEIVEKNLDNNYLSFFHTREFSKFKFGEYQIIESTKEYFDTK